jgi:hypothetical protein
MSGISVSFESITPSPTLFIIIIILIAIIMTIKLTKLVPHRPAFLGIPASFPPADAEAPPSSWTAIPMSVPRRAPMAVTNCDAIAARLENPDWTSRAKSPTSWGISWKKTATVVVAPIVGEA